MKTWLLSFAILVALGVALAQRPSTPPLPSELRKSADKIRPLVAKKTPPEAGDWLAQHPERGQTFDQFLTSRPNRPTDRLTTLYLQPIGDFTKAQEPLIKDTQEILRVVFGLPVKVLAPLPDSEIPATARRVHPRWGMSQFLSTYILNYLKSRRPADAVAVLGLTATDLYPQPSWNFVFGQASLNERVGVWSLARYGDAEKDYITVLRRTLLVAVHETGHMFSIQHCIASECGMNGSNNLEESDRAPMAFCAECDLKLWWSCRLSPAARYAALADFAKARGLTRDEADLRKRVDALAGER